MLLDAARWKFEKNFEPAQGTCVDVPVTPLHRCDHRVHQKKLTGTFKTWEILYNRPADIRLIPRSYLCVC
jgi:hypothetical protein